MVIRARASGKTIPRPFDTTCEDSVRLAEVLSILREQVGLYAEGSSGNLSLDNCLASHNLYGEFAYGTLYSSSTMIVRNDTGVLAASGGSVISWGNNRLANNTTDGSFSSTTGLH